MEEDPANPGSLHCLFLDHLTGGCEQRMDWGRGWRRTRQIRVSAAQLDLQGGFNQMDLTSGFDQLDLTSGFDQRILTSWI